MHLLSKFSEYLNAKNQLTRRLCSVHPPGIQFIGEDKVPFDPWPGYKFTGPLRPWPRTIKFHIPPHIGRPDYADHPKHHSLSEELSREGQVISVLDDEAIKKMRRASRLAREVLDEIAKKIKVGVTGEEIDMIAYETCIERSCYPSPYNYYGFPGCVCTSLNEVVCHGIPNSRPLLDGDIVNVDVTVYHDGYHGDLSETFLVGQVDSEAQRLVETTHECLTRAIELVKPGVPYDRIGEVIEEHAHANGFSVVRGYTGHGIHKLFHCPPTIYHYRRNKSSPVMRQGHTFTIEPMLNEGTCRTVEWPDDWTVVTADGKRSAQFEQTLLVTATGCEILTGRSQHTGLPYFRRPVEGLNQSKQ